MPDRQIILITGASRGIGRHLVGHYLSQNFSVIGCSRSKPTEPVVGTGSENYHHHVVDITSETDVVKMMNTIRAKFGRLDVLVNNAAVNPTLSLVMMTSMKAATETFATNVLGTFVVSREAAKLMMRSKFGRIICMSSMAVRHEVQGEALYSASKAALHSMARVMAKEFNSLGITCNVLAPAAIPTEMMQAVNQDALNSVLQRNAIPRMGEFTDVSNAIDFLIRPESSAITGQIIYLGGA
jgi:3-oxoacyl-[acyl-carrier protein] reductase